jgi:hypothetical protein
MAAIDGTETLGDILLPMIQDGGVSETIKVWAEDFANLVFSSDNFQTNPKERHSGIYGYAIREARIVSGTAGDFLELPLSRVSDMYVKACSHITMKIQNITTADSTTDANASLLNHIESNPLQGKLYHFNGPIPLLKKTYKKNDNATLAVTKFAVPKADGCLMPATDDTVVLRII